VTNVQKIGRILIHHTDPVEITISADGKRISVKPLSEDYLSLARNPAYASSSLVQNAAAASRLIVTTSDYIAHLMTSGAESFTTRTKPQKPVSFTTATHDRVRKINKMTASAATISTRTVGQVTKIAQNVGATLARRGERKSKEDKLADNGDDYKPGILNKSMIAFSTLADGIATGGKHLLDSSGSAATAVVGYRYGDDARQVANELTKSITNVGLVYIDVTGVSRRAVIKSVAKGMVVGRVSGSGNAHVVVGEGDGGEIPQNVLHLQHGGEAGPSGEPPKYTPGDYKPSGPEKYS
jgi:spartin